MRFMLPIALIACLAACKPDAPPADMLAALPVGQEWQVTQIAGRPVPEGVKVNLLHPEAEQIAGNSGCNRYSAPVERRDGKLHIGAIVGTRMMCSELQMQTEQAFHAAIARVDSVAATQDGIELRADGQPVIIAVRPAD
ncbi:META domain-containing protein [Thioclava sp. GXIMD4216]|uniref:META domain-containing protein n=1 Tax=Thioclava sp. GXIMD4216 TaxID=3131929 RepID=UPI0030CCDEED